MGGLSDYFKVEREGNQKGIIHRYEVGDGNSGYADRYAVVADVNAITQALKRGEFEVFDIINFIAESRDTDLVGPIRNMDKLISGQQPDKLEAARLICDLRDAVMQDAVCSADVGFHEDALEALQVLAKRENINSPQVSETLKLIQVTKGLNAAGIISDESAIRPDRVTMTYDLLKIDLGVDHGAKVADVASVLNDLAQKGIISERAVKGVASSKGSGTVDLTPSGSVVLVADGQSDGRMSTLSVEISARAFTTDASEKLAGMAAERPAPVQGTVDNGTRGQTIQQSRSATL